MCLAVVACGSPPVHALASPSVVTGGSLGTLGTPGCAPGAVFQGWKSADGFPEAGLDTNRGSVWALFIHAVPPSAGQEIKVVWRMTGSGGFNFTVSDSAGKQVPLAWGPEGHGGSNWNHPGDEVGTGFNFPHAGCWDIHLARSDVRADLWLGVVA